MGAGKFFARKKDAQKKKGGEVALAARLSAGVAATSSW
jgi:hypothetical protein